MAHTSDLLFQFLRDRSHDLAALSLDHRPPAPFSSGDVYLLSSALQKAIRRNDLAVARRAGFQLLALDPTRLWRRIMTVGLEDIGIGDTTVAAELVGLATLKAGRRIVGGDRAALEVALKRACAAIKDRTGDHLASVLTREPIDAADAEALNSASRNALAAIIASSEIPWTRRVRAAALLSGRNGERYSTARMISALWGTFADRGVPDVLIAACSAYASHSRDPLSVLVPMAWLLSVPGRTKKTSVPRATQLLPAMLPRARSSGRKAAQNA